jgi:hypothetical protein
MPQYKHKLMSTYKNTVLIKKYEINLFIVASFLTLQTEMRLYLAEAAYGRLIDKN